MGRPAAVAAAGPSAMAPDRRPMNLLILGDGPEERRWAEAVARSSTQRVVAAHPGLPGLPLFKDLDGALAAEGVEAVVVGGPDELRAEGLRRAAAAGFPCVVLHPPGPDALPYDAVALSGFEAGAVVVPDLPGRLHPAFEALRRAVDGWPGLIGPFRELRYERAVGPGEGGLRSHAFARAVDVVRALLGEVAQVTATGDPPEAGPDPTDGLVVQVRAESARRAEVRLRAAPKPGDGRIEVVGEEGTLIFEHAPDWSGPGRLYALVGDRVEPLDREGAAGFDPRLAILDALSLPIGPTLLDGTRAMEAASAVGRALRRHRTVDLHHEEVSEAGNFKTIMISTGCLLLAAALVILPIALAGQAIGIGATRYLAYLIPPALVLFLVLQFLRLGIREAKGPRPS